MSFGYGGGDRYGGGGGYGGGFGGGGGGGFRGGGGGGRGRDGPGANLRDIDWSRERLAEFKKDFYEEDEKVMARSGGEIKDWLKDKEVTIIENGKNKCPRPCYRFEEAGLPKAIMKTIAKAGFEAPTPIQSIGFPIGLS